MCNLVNKGWHLISKQMMQSFLLSSLIEISLSLHSNFPSKSAQKKRKRGKQRSQIRTIPLNLNLHVQQTSSLALCGLSKSKQYGYHIAPTNSLQHSGYLYLSTSNESDQVASVRGGIRQIRPVYFYQDCEFVSVIKMMKDD